MNAAWIAHLDDCVQSACLLEATARKPGNVHPEASFADLNYEHFRQAARILGPVVAQAGCRGVGATILTAVRAICEATPSNANLGIVLLLAPLAAVPAELSLATGIEGVLDRLTRDDARQAYEAIRLARPGGLGRVLAEDVANPPTVTLREAMSLAAAYDAIAAQYACGFADILSFGAPLLSKSVDFETNWERSIIHLHLAYLARRPDSLIARKCGPETAAEASRRARILLDAGWHGGAGSAARLNEFDAWLRADGNRRNPGATADLVAATLFAGFRERLLPIPAWAKLSSSPG